MIPQKDLEKQLAISMVFKLPVGDQETQPILMKIAELVCKMIIVFFCWRVGRIIIYTRIWQTL